MCARILLVDDDPRNLNILEGMLAPLSYDVRRAQDGAQALAQVTVDPPDLILLDVMMPGLSGFEVCRRLKSQTETQFIPIVLVTALGEREMKVIGIEAGADDFITKPVDPHELRARVKSLLRIKALHDELQQRYLELQRLERMRDTLTQMIVHDLRAPLTGVMHHLHLVARHLQQAVESRAVVMFLRSPRDHALWATAKVGLPDEVLGRVKIASNSSLVRLMERHRVIEVSRQNVSEVDWPGLQQMSSVLLVPMTLRSELLGAISLGPRLSDGAYTAEDHTFLAAVADQVAVGIDHVRLREQEQEVDTARAIQQRLLPTTMPQLQGYGLAGAWQPARAVGGDYFDVVPFSERTVGLCIADVVGKGMPAALLMSNVQAAVKAVAAEHVPPKALCEHVNRVMYSNIAAGKFITLFYGLLDAASKRLLYTNAGHNLPILVRRDGSQMRLNEGGTVLGVFEEWPYQQGEVTLASGDRVVLFTDGVTEAQDGSGHEFGEERLLNLITEHRTLSATDLHQRVLNAVVEFGGGEVQDDVTLLVLAVE